MAEEARSFLSDINDDLHCSICLELFTDARALQCLHTFCQRCIEQWIKDDKIPCPKCRNETARRDIVNNFQINKFVEAYKRQKGKPVRPTSPNSGANIKCVLCDANTAQTICHRCNRYLCSTCQQAHLKMSKCRQRDAENLDYHKVEEYLRNLESTAAQMMQGTDRLKQHYNSIVALIIKFRGKCLQGIDESEDEIITDVRQTHENKRCHVTKICDEKIEEMTRRRDEHVGRAEELMEHITAVAESTEALMDTHELVERQINRVLAQINQQIFIPIKVKLRNRGLKAFDSSKTVLVEEEDSSLPVNSRAEAESLFAEDSSGFDGQLERLKTKILTAQKLAEKRNWVNQMQVVEGHVWALKWDAINVLGDDGSISRTYTPGMTDARDMCVTGSGHVVVATEKSGLLQLNSMGEVIRCIDKGKYLTVTSGDEGSVWAVKEEQQGSNVWITQYEISVSGCEQVARFQTTLAGEKCVYCALLGQTLYVSRERSHCIYAIDTRDGHTVATHGSQGKQAPGELHNPRGIYSDNLSKSLLIMDCGNHRLQVLEPATNSWSRVQTNGAEVKFLTTAAVDRQRQMWVTGFHSYTLYKCTVDEE